MLQVHDNSWQKTQAGICPWTHVAAHFLCGWHHPHDSMPPSQKQNRHTHLKTQQCIYVVPGWQFWMDKQNRVKSDSHYLRHLLFTAPYIYLDSTPPQNSHLTSLETWDSPTSPKLSKTITTDLSHCSRPLVLRSATSYTQLRFTVLKEPADITVWEVTQRWQRPRRYCRRWKPTEEVKVSGRHLSGPAYKAGCLWEALWFEAASSALAPPLSCTNSFYFVL